jgi:hypothetical protein
MSFRDLWDGITNSEAGKFVSGVVEGVGEFFEPVASFIDKTRQSPFGKIASAGYDYFQQSRAQQLKGGTPKVGRVSAPRSLQQQQIAQAAKANLGFTNRVQAAARSASNARAGTSINASIQAIAYRRAKSPMINFGNTQIKIKKRAR